MALGLRLFLSGEDGVLGLCRSVKFDGARPVVRGWVSLSRDRREGWVSDLSRQGWDDFGVSLGLEVECFPLFVHMP